MARGNLKGLNVSLMIDNYANLNLPLEVWWMGQDMRVWSLDLNERLVYLIFKIISDIKVIGVRSIFLPGGKGRGGGGGKILARKILASCPNFYETVEKRRGPYDATT